MCLKQGSIADELKVARVTPIYKSDSKDEFSNYKPISVLPICSNILEKIVHKQLYKYVTDNKLTYVGQSGFLQQHSSYTALVKTHDKWNVETDKGNYYLAAFGGKVLFSSCFFLLLLATLLRLITSTFLD